MSYLHVLVLFLAVVSLTDMARYQIHAQHDGCANDPIHDQRKMVSDARGPPITCIPRIPGMNPRRSVRPPPNN